MKKLLLPAMIAAGLFGLSACDDKPEAKNTANTEEKATEQVAKVISADSATQAEQAFKAFTDAGQTYYQSMLSSHPMIKSVSYQMDSYTKGAETSTAITKGTIALNMKIDDKDTFDLTFKHTIKHDTETLAKGLIASIDSTIEKPADAPEELNQVLDNMSYTTDIKADGAFTQKMVIKQLSFGNDGEKALFNGLETTIHSTLTDMASGFGSGTFDFKGATFSTTQADDNFVIEPFGLTGEYKPSGEFNFKSTTPLLMGDSETKVQIADINAHGTMLINHKLGVMLGKQNYEFKQVQVTGSGVPMPLNIGSINADVDTAVNDKELLSQSMNIAVVPAAGLTSMLSQGMLDVSKAEFAYQLNDVPAAVLTEYQGMMKGMYSDLDDDSDSAKKAIADMKPRLKVMFDTAKAQGSNLALNLKLTAAEGLASIDAKADMLANSTVTFEALENMQSPKQIFNLLDISANAKIPAALLEKTGAHMMVGPFLQKVDDAYQATITTQDGQLLINGMPAPM